MFQINFKLFLKILEKRAKSVVLYRKVELSTVYLLKIHLKYVYKLVHMSMC